MPEKKNSYTCDRRIIMFIACEVAFTEEESSCCSVWGLYLQ